MARRHYDLIDAHADSSRKRAMTNKRPNSGTAIAALPSIYGDARDALFSSYAQGDGV